jgi:hypothetical protein
MAAVKVKHSLRRKEGHIDFHFNLGRHCNLDAFKTWHFTFSFRQMSYTVQSSCLYIVWGASQCQVIPNFENLSDSYLLKKKWLLTRNKLMPRAPVELCVHDFRECLHSFVSQCSLNFPRHLAGQALVRWVVRTSVYFDSFRSAISACQLFKFPLLHKSTLVTGQYQTHCGSKHSESRVV